MAAKYGITDIDGLFKTILLLQLRSGEVLITHAQSMEKGLVTFVPMKLTERDEGTSLNPFLPYVKERFFFIDYMDVQILKGQVHDYIQDSYRSMTSTMYKNEISDLMAESLANSREREQYEEEVSSVPSVDSTKRAMTLH